MKKRRNNYMKKRVTFRALFIRALALVLALTAVFAVAFQIYLTNYIDDQCRERIDEYIQMMSNYITNCQKNRGQSDWMPSIQKTMVWTGNGFCGFSMPGSEKYGIDPGWTPNCYACAVLTDEQGNIVASNRRALTTSVFYSTYYFGDDSVEPEDDSGAYICDPIELNIPELTQLFDQYDELWRQVNEDPSLRYDDYYNPSINVQMEFTSAYVNPETRTCIPHEGAIIKYKYYEVDSEEHNYYSEELERIPVQIDLDLPGYELVELTAGFNSDEVDYPIGGSLWLFGVKQEVIDEFARRWSFSWPADNIADYVNGQYTDGTMMMMRSIYVMIGQQRYLLSVRVIIDHAAPSVVKYFCTRVLFFAAALSLLSLLWCLWKNQKNKLRYAMEDYQRALTDNLAHDIKTPLMAISGYTENVLKGRLTEAERAEYLNAILDNVSYTDSLVSRTLQLNHMGEARQAKPERIALEKLAAELLQKYEPLLGEKQITHSIDGSAAVQADPAAMETILENLISNAVKYTPERGEVRVAVEKKVLRVTNSVAQKLDVKKLKEPFVRGDAARSNVKGNGLGLALAEQAARLNGFKLNLNCTDKTFTAELKM